LVQVEDCIGCEECIPYCTVGALSMGNDGVVVVDGSRCTDCYVCIRSKCCPVDTIVPGPLNTFNDNFRHVLSDPTETTAETGVPGRGTEESKTNDVTGRFRKDEAGICIDMGRPGVGVRMRDVEKVAVAVVRAGLKIPGPEETPLAKVMADRTTGKLKDDVLDEYLLSIIIEGTCPLDKVEGVLRALRSVEKEIDTVFSLGIVLQVDENGYHPVLDTLEAFGIKPYRGKVNVGFGRPLAT